MKILFISHSSVLKFHQQKLIILAEKYRHDVTLVTPPYWMEGGVKITAFTGYKEINYLIGKTLMIDRRFFHFYYNPDEIIKKVKPDIVHIEEEPFTPVCMEFVRVAKKRNKKAVFFTWENIERKYNPLYSVCERYDLKNSDAAIAGNLEAKELLIKKGFLNDVGVIPQYGINTEEFLDKDFHKSKEEYNVVYIGRLTKEKGIDILLEAVCNIQNVKLHIAGTGSMLQEIKQKIEKLNVQNKVIFHSYVAREKIPEFLNKMDILVLPSVTTPNWKEQFGRVIIEAFAAKVAVIGSDSGAIPEVIDDAGIVFKENNAMDLRNKLENLIKDKDLYMECIKKGYERVKNKYTNERIAADLVELYKRIF
jgi:glycosyltransferase involved in cell wall biosynthesis